MAEQRKTAILYYSWSGRTRRVAEQMAAEQEADLFEIKENHRRSLPGTVIPGCLQALGGKRSRIQAPPVNLNDYDSLTLAGPVWAGCPAPAFNSMISLLPVGKEVFLVLTSGSGDSSKGAQRVQAAVRAQGCVLAAYTDIKTE